MTRKRSDLIRIAIVGACMLVVLGSGGLFAQERRANPDRGQVIYELHCTRCHGPSGEGNGPDARTLIVPPANFHLGQQRVKTDEELFIAVSDGVLFSPMHGWRGRLSERDIEDVVEYLRVMVPFLPLS